MSKSRMRHLLWGAVIPVMATASPGLAQEAPDSEAPAARESALVIESVTVTARRQEENLQTTPVAVSVLGAQQLERQQVLDVSSLQYVTPNFTVAPATGDSSAANISVRGQSQADNLIALDPAIGIYLDGVYVARSTGALFNLVDMQRVEVLRGAQGTLYGRNTTGGAVNLIANRPDDKFGGSLNARIGDFDLREITAVANLPINDTAGLRIAYQRSERGGYGTNTLLNTELADDKSDFVRVMFTAEPPGTGFDLTLSADYTDRSNNGQLIRLIEARPVVFAGATPVAGVASLVPTVCSGGPAAALCPVSRPGDRLTNYTGGDFYEIESDLEGPFNDLEAGGGSLTLTKDFASFSARYIGASRFTRSDSFRDLDGTPYRLLESGGQIDQDQTSHEFQVFGDSFGDRVNWIAGIFLFEESGSDNSQSFNLWPLRTTRNNITADASNESIAYYGQATLSLSDKLRLTGGLRYTEDDRSLSVENIQVSGFTGAFASCSFPTAALAPGSLCTSKRKASFDYVSYLASMDYQLSDNVFLYAKTSRASRAGGFNIRGVAGSSLDAFNPEQVTDYEIGAKLDLLDRRLRLNAAVYSSEYDDIQRTVVTVANGQLVAFVQNAAKATINGAELEVTAIPIENLRLNAVVGLTNPEYDSFIDPFTGADRSKEPFPRTPETTFAASAAYTVNMAAGDLTGNIDYAWRSDVFFNVSDFSRQEAYGLINATLTFNTDKYKIGIFGRNLTDEEYFPLILDTTSTPLGLAVGFPGEPMTFGVNLGVNF